MSEEIIPNTLEECIEHLEEIMDEVTREEIEESETEDVMAQFHHSIGQAIRNSWGLWKGDNDLTRWFNSIGITHADDMSGIIFTSLWRHIKEKPIDVEAQVEHYQKHWKAAGYKDGIPK